MRPLPSPKLFSWCLSLTRTGAAMLAGVWANVARALIGPGSIHVVFVHEKKKKQETTWAIYETGMDVSPPSYKGLAYAVLVRMIRVFEDICLAGRSALQHHRHRGHACEAERISNHTWLRRGRVWVVRLIPPFEVRFCWLATTYTVSKRIVDDLLRKASWSETVNQLPEVKFHVSILPETSPQWADAFWTSDL